MVFGRPLVGAFLLTLALTGCNLGDVPGSPSGAFRVRGTLMENTCGSAALPAMEELRFEVELRDAIAQAYWHRRGRAPVEGIRGEDGTYEFGMRSQIRVVPADPAVGDPGCAFEQLESIRGTIRGASRYLDAGSPDASDGSDGASDAGPDAGTSDGGTMTPGLVFEGENTITLSPASGSSCGRTTQAEGGPFLALPCRVRYDLDGDERTPFER